MAICQRAHYPKRHDRVDAPWLIDAPINGERFQLYINEILIPTLRPIVPNGSDRIPALFGLISPGAIESPYAWLPSDNRSLPFVALPPDQWSKWKKFWYTINKGNIWK